MPKHNIAVTDDIGVLLQDDNQSIVIYDNFAQEQIVLTITNAVKTHAAILSCLRHAGTLESTLDAEQGWTFGDGKQRFDTYREAMDAMYATNDTGITRRGLRVWGLP